MADIPGIIEGASKGKGLGIRFLKHIERNAVLLFMVPADTARTIQEEYDILLNELNEYNPELMHKPRVLAITKSDMLDDELIAEMKEQVPADIPSVFISSVAQKNIDVLKDLLWREINSQG
jgi:GTP-binding protein